MNDVARKPYIFASDFDQTLSFNDSGLILSQLIGATDFTGKVNGLSRMHFIQQGGELAYLLLHDPEYRCVRKEHLIEVGKQVRLKSNIRLLSQLLEQVDGKLAHLRYPAKQGLWDGSLQQQYRLGDPASMVGHPLHRLRRGGGLGRRGLRA